tara:strand:- start:732 stop:1979 length:1248 start_codon:yes stop_codon:yes gene_type:complete
MLLKKILKILILTLIFVSLCELIIRIIDFQNNKTVSNAKNHTSYFSNYRNHPFLQYTGKINQDGYQIHLEPGKYYKTSTNSDGFRSREFYPKVEDGSYRVMILGDSFVWGYNANDHETLGANLEKILKKKINTNIEVYSLGVPSYSAIIYQGIARTYFDILKPDLVIIAIDQNDFFDDQIRKDLFKKDEDNLPYYYSKYKDQNKLTSIDGNYRELKSKIKLTSSLLDKMIIFKHQLIDPIIYKYKIKKIKSNYTILKYEDISENKKANLYEHFDLHRDNICCNLEISKNKFKTTFDALKYVKNKSDEINAKLYLSTYPYAWFIDPKQSLEWQLKLYKGKYILDFRKNNVYPELVNYYADKLNIKNLNFYDYIKENPGNYWGKFDPHFNAYGYEKYAEFLSKKIITFIEKDIINKK